MRLLRALSLSALAFVVATGCVSNRSGKPSSCLVAIDIGHSELAQGAISSRGSGEFFFNRNIAQLLLEKIRTNDIAQAFIIEDRKDAMPLKERTEVARLHHADFLISIHHDSVQPSYLSVWTYGGVEHRYSDRFHGFSLFVSKKNPRPAESFELAQSVGSSLLKAGFSPTLHHAEKIQGENRELADPKRGIYIFDDLIVLKSAAMPAVLLECGVILNRNEEANLSNRSYQDKLVAAVAAGIEQACAHNRKPPKF